MNYQNMYEPDPFSKEQQIKTLIEYFDFDIVHKTMKALDWRWGGDEESPTHGKLVNTAINLLHSCYAEAVRAYAVPSYTVATGGFVAKSERYGSEIYLSLGFEVTKARFCDLVDTEGKE